MRIEEAKKIVRDVLQESFDKERFIYFVKNLLNKIDESKARHFRGYVPEIFKNFVKTYERIGTYTDPDGKKIDVMIVYLQKESAMERARTAQRNFMARYLKTRGEKDAALVAFVVRGSLDWRFSLVTMEYKLTKTAKGNVVPKAEFTAPKRYSFIVGANESCHTAQSSLVPIMLDDERKPTLASLEDAFNIEKVTKEFFNKYRELFHRLHEAIETILKKDKEVRKDFETKEVNPVDFAKKLLGQIVFLYFLQKKGWFGVNRKNDWGTGSKQFLRELFDQKHGKYTNFFNDIMEPLLYEALRSDRSKDGDYYSRFDCRIPFLNGGLFDPINDYNWWNTDILIPNELFSNDIKTLEGDKGNGIFNVFDRYNFTVKEDEPLEKEVAVDPEMLGKVFENLLEVKDRKSKGTYYTPREIVHYMCQESLMNYLETELDGTVCEKDIKTLIKYGEAAVEHDSRVVNEGQETERYSFQLPLSVRDHAKLIDEKLASIRVCDPAVGSGAFPVGMMNEIIRARNALTPYICDGDRSPYNFKRNAIQFCLYGVDIDPGAIEIAKLRLWLSLIVDEDDIKEIKPLPNLDFKIMQGNSLISEFMGENLDETGTKRRKAELDVFDGTSELYKELKKKKELFIYQAYMRHKEDLRHEIEDIIVQIFEKKVKRSRDEYFLQLKDIESKYTRLQNSELRDQIIVKEKEKLRKNTGFDLEAAEKQLREYTTGHKIRPFFAWNLYFSEIFDEQNGFDVVIANPPYIQLQSNSGQQANLYKNQNYETFERTGDIYSLFYEKGINLLKPKGHLTFITSNKWMRAAYGKSTRAFFCKHKPVTLIDLGSDVFESATVDTNILIMQKTDEKTPTCSVNALDISKEKEIISFDRFEDQWIVLQNLTEESWTIASLTEQQIKEKIERVGKPLKEWDIQIHIGLLTGYNKAFIIDGKKKEEILSNCQDKAERERTKVILKPVLRGRDIKRYKAEYKDLWLINSHNGVRGKIPRINVKKDYPAVYRYLKQYEAELNKRQDKGDHWSNLRNCAYLEDFEKEKIIFQEMVQCSSFLYDKSNYFCLDTGRIITGCDLKFLTCVLNSNLFFFSVKYFYGGGGLGVKGVRMKHTFFNNFCVPKLTKQYQQPFISLVDKIISGKDRGKDTSALERQIDRMVYDLYSLTDEEIAVIEEDESGTGC